MAYKLFIIAVAAALSMPMAGCSKSFVGGAAAGGAVAGGAYEYSNKRQLDDLEDDFEDGKISEEEYKRRKREIEKRSLVY